MKPTLESFDVVKEGSGYAVTTIYDLFSIGTPKILHILPTLTEAEEHMQRCFNSALKEYERCQKQGCSFPYND